MGNAPSVETLHSQPNIHTAQGNIYSPPPAKRQPQKLSKPRVGNHASSNTASRRRDSNAPSIASSVSPLPPNPSPNPNQNLSVNTRRSSALPSPVMLSPAPSIFPNVPTASSIRPETTSDPTGGSKDWYRRSSGLFRSKSSQEDRTNRRRSGLVPPMPGERPSRANSMNWESQANLDHARQQLESGNVAGNRQSVNYDMSSYESRRLLNMTDQPLVQEPESVTVEPQLGEIDQATWKSSHPHEVPAVSIPRVDSNVSLYAPARRRSVIQTPGVATRKPGDSSVSRKSSFRHSHPPTPVGGRSRRGSYVAEAEVVRVISMPPPRVIAVDEVERVETPSELDYRQLGAMKHGSLRITNGAASPVPSVEGDLPHDKAFGRAPECEIPMTGQTPKQTLAPITTTFINHKAVSSVPQSTFVGYHEPGDTSAHCLSPEYAPYEVLDVREDPSAKPAIERPVARQDVAQGVVRIDSGLVVTPMSEAPADVLRPLAKADSGYSSNVSLRSFSSKKAVGGNERPSRARTDGKAKTSNDAMDTSPNDLNEMGSTQSCMSDHQVERNTALSPRGCSPTDVASPKQVLPPGSPLQSASDDLHSPSPSSKMRKRLHASSSYIFGRTPEKPESAPASSATMDPVEERPSSTLSIGGNSSNRNKLQRLLSGASMRGPPAVHPTHSVESSIPSIPREVEAKLMEHTGKYPMMSKQLTVHHQPSKDTLKTILSVGSVEASGINNIRDSLTSPEATLAPVAETSKGARRRSLQPISASISQAAAAIMSRKSIRRKPISTHKQQSDQSQENELIQNGFESSVTSIDSNRDSVGRSAFDQAFTALAADDHQHTDTRRSMTMTAQQERDLGYYRPPPIRTKSSASRQPWPSCRSPIPELPETSPPRQKTKSMPPVSLRTRRKSAGASTQSMSRKSSRDSLQGPLLSAPPVPSIKPEFQHPQHAAFSSVRAGHLDSANRGTSSAANHGIYRPMSATIGAQQVRSPGLRHRSSYDGHSSLQRHAGFGQGRYQTSTQMQMQTGEYYQNQLLQLQEQSWRGEEQNLVRSGPADPRLGHSRNQSGGTNPPYRILHSYNSPAYRNVQLWS
ncbi:uncharacterized protein VDAG_01895 [Verticillium dahliae VdLs.17]|uniref:Proteophosphoglycan ppg4 n=1 Tax=Verticillium dahliae (strain VdLs.17 / ATCC MYA-4575 / FGSC 10137) TaxID=498257 RepID=G2WWA9_VERDV|nr:uncharacterized protein VDAG_01895 [Verticillium dahliae VdLs.17]EGY19879.1 hypothetical protein VDAG_01895 [Verticillium dahliae VdLs.17]KAH6685643.1 hypothetical protein EV126DRAFT_350820 [Verticillium dahliae]